MSQALWQALELLMGWDKILPFNNLTTYRKKNNLYPRIYLQSNYNQVCQHCNWVGFRQDATGASRTNLLWQIKAGFTEVVKLKSWRMSMFSEAISKWGQCKIPELICKSSYFYLCVRLGDFSKRNKWVRGWLHFFFFNLTQVEREVSYFSQYFWFWFSMNISF